MGQKVWVQVGTEGTEAVLALCPAPSLHAHLPSSLGSVTGHTGEAAFFSVQSKQQKTGGVPGTTSTSPSAIPDPDVVLHSQHPHSSALIPKPRQMPHP